jgi:hypothetical protein
MIICDDSAQRLLTLQDAEAILAAYEEEAA